MDLTSVFDPDNLTLAELIIAAAIVVVAAFVARAVRRRIRHYLAGQDGVEDYVAPLAGRIAGWTIMIFGILIALGVLGFDLAPVMLFLLIVIGILALSGRGILENFASGLMLQIRGPFRPEDRIDVAGYAGVVKEINARAVVVETSDRRTVHVPNRDVLNNPIVNYTEYESRRSDVEVGIGYADDIERARQVALEVMAGVPTVLAEPAPIVFVSELGDSAVILTLEFWHTDDDRTRARSGVTEAVKIAFDSAGIDMPFPQQVVTVQNGGKSDTQSEEITREGRQDT
ncbi:MAG: mechanosensitive ion channel family protein [Acidimicrobiia bacterium]